MQHIEWQKNQYNAVDGTFYDAINQQTLWLSQSYEYETQWHLVEKKIFCQFLDFIRNTLFGNDHLNSDFIS